MIYILKRIGEFQTILEQISRIATIFTLDVENLFTDVLVVETIEIVLADAYNYSQIKPLSIPAASLKIIYLWRG